jgi:hypothetical protein
MRKNIGAVLLAVGLLAGCASVSPIMPVGPDTYMVSTTAPAAGGGNLKAELYQKAGEFCASQKKVLMPVAVASSDASFGKKGSAELTFRCLCEGDPELKRPSAEAVSNKTIETTSSGVGVGISFPIGR